ncbi:hypothetical protein GDO81_024859 [Engystomops pustulosus]|uniref:Laminin EGF-like domain-containing protein n=1 Tax=Engystomops pustulosus TaxID=76066 RepID=A0AAV6ZAS0_ENGPU|nr:hypothetical protein GDO81_024859 [Engystomops pustulosus]
MYNDQPWRPGDGKTGDPNECRRCRCHNHAVSCHFDHNVWLSSGEKSGGVCEKCQHNTEGSRCHRCQAGYYRDPSVPISSPMACKGKSENTTQRRSELLKGQDAQGPKREVLKKLIMGIPSPTTSYMLYWPCDGP